MSTTNGYFDETLLLKRVARANALGQDGRLIADTIPFMETIKAVTENSTMQFENCPKYQVKFSNFSINAHYLLRF